MIGNLTKFRLVNNHRLNIQITHVTFWKPGLTILNPLSIQTLSKMKLQPVTLMKKHYPVDKITNMQLIFKIKMNMVWNKLKQKKDQMPLQSKIGLMDPLLVVSLL